MRLLTLGRSGRTKPWTHWWMARCSRWLHRSKRSKCWKLPTVGLDLPEDSGNNTPTRVTLFKVEFCTTSFIAVFGCADLQTDSDMVHGVVGTSHFVLRSSELLEAASRTTSLLPSQQYTSKGYPVRQGSAVEQLNSMYGPVTREHTSYTSTATPRPPALWW